MQSPQDECNHESKRNTSSQQTKEGTKVSLFTKSLSGYLITFMSEKKYETKIKQRRTPLFVPHIPVTNVRGKAMVDTMVNTLTTFVIEYDVSANS